MDEREKLVRRMVAEGKSDEEIQAALARFPSSVAPADATDRTIRNPDATNPIVDAAVSVVQGASFGLADNVIPGMKGRLEKARRNMGALSTAGEMAGGALTGAGVAKLGAKATSPLVRAATGNVTAPTRLGRVGQASLAGGTAGGVYGAAETEDGSSRVLGGLKGASLGGAGGAFLAGLIEAPGAIRKFAPKVAAKARDWAGRTSPEEYAGREFARPLAGDRLDLIAAAERANEGDIGADLLGKQTLARARQAMGVGGADVGDAQRAIEARLADQSFSPKTRVAARSGVSPDDSPRKAVRDIATEYRPKIDEQYQAFYKNTEGGIDDAGLIAFLNREGPSGGADPVMSQVRARVMDVLRRRYENDPVRFAKVMRQQAPSAPGTSVAPQGVTSGAVAKGAESEVLPVLSGEYVDEAKRELDFLYKQAKRGGDEGLARSIRERIDGLTGIVDKLHPEYAAARGYDTERRALQESSALGSTTVKSGTADVRDVRDLELPGIVNKKGVSDAGKTRAGVEYQKGAARQLLNLDDDEIWKVAGSERGWRRLMQSVPEGEADALQAELMQRWAQIAKERSVMGAPVSANGADLSDPDVFGRLTPWAVAAALRGNPMLAAAQGVGAMNAAKMRGNEVKANELIARFTATPVRAGGKVNPAFLEMARVLQGQTRRAGSAGPAPIRKWLAPTTRSLGQAAGRNTSRRDDER